MASNSNSNSNTNTGNGGSGSGNSGRAGPFDYAWKYFTQVKPPNTNITKCNFCDKILNGGIHRAKQHLVGGYRNAAKCKSVPENVSLEIKALMDSKSMGKAEVKMSVLEEGLYPEDGEDEVDTRPQSQSGTSNTMRPPTSNSKKRKFPGLMDKYLKKMDDRKAKERQTTINEAYKKELREKGVLSIARWLYDAAIPLNAITYPSFREMINDIALHGPGFKLPSYHEIRVPCLTKIVKEVEDDYVGVCRAEWAKYGCSLMVDGWTDKRQRTIINFLVNSPRGSVFIESVDASDYSKTGTAMCDLLDKFVEKVGEQNVVQIITDNASNMKLGGRMLEAKRQHLYWTPCAAHCIDLMLEDIGKIPEFKSTLKKAMSVTAFTYVRPGVVNMLRQFIGQVELCRAGVTRFATAFLTLQRMMRLKNELRKMFTSDNWTQSKWSKEPEGKTVVKIILAPKFWTSVLYILKIYGPLVRVLRLVDGEKKPAMGYIYEAMDRAKETIMNSFDNEDRYRDIFEIIDKRWECQLHQPLHAAGHFLNPEFFYASGEVAEEVNHGFHKCVERLVPDPREQDKISVEIETYHKAEGLFGLSMAMRQRSLLSPAVWWERYGTSTPHLQKFAIKVLSLTCSSSGCERNWSIFENVHAKRRNRLLQQRMNDLVFVKYNRSLKRRYDSRDRVDPISLKDIDECNEWLGDRSDEDEDLVFENDDLNWNVVGDALGVDEPEYQTRGRKSSTCVGSSSVGQSKDKGKGKQGDKSKEKCVKTSSFRLRDEDIDDIEVEEDEEEYIDDDEHFDEDEEEEGDEVFEFNDEDD